MRDNSFLTIAGIVGGFFIATLHLLGQQSIETSPSLESLPASQANRPTQQVSPDYNLTGTLNLKATSIIGLPVRNTAGELLGKVQDLLVNWPSGSSAFIVIKHGGTAGIGETRVAVPLADLKLSAEPDQLILPVTKGQFEAAASAPTGAWLAVAGEDWNKNVDRFYGQPVPAMGTRFERQETPPTREGRELVRTPTAEPKGATKLQNQPPALPETRVTPLDEDILRQVNSLVLQDAGQWAEDIRATVKDGTVNLAGRIADQAQRKLLAQHIMALPGVIRVVDGMATALQ